MCANLHVTLVVMCALVHFFLFPANYTAIKQDKVDFTTSLLATIGRPPAPNCKYKPGKADQWKTCIQKFLLQMQLFRKKMLKYLAIYSTPKFQSSDSSFNGAPDNAELFSTGTLNGYKMRLKGLQAKTNSIGEYVVIKVNLQNVTGASEGTDGYKLELTQEGREIKWSVLAGENRTSGNNSSSLGWIVLTPPLDVDGSSIQYQVNDNILRIVGPGSGEFSPKK